MIRCENCGAECREKKDERRFSRRHPKLCKRHERFQRGLAEGIACVEDEEPNPVSDGARLPSERFYEL